MRGRRRRRSVAQSRERPDGADEKNGPNLLRIIPHSNEHLAVECLFRNCVEVLDKGIDLGEERVVSAQDGSRRETSTRLQHAQVVFKRS